MKQVALNLGGLVKMDWLHVFTTLKLICFFKNTATQTENYKHMLIIFSGTYRFLQQNS